MIAARACDHWTNHSYSRWTIACTWVSYAICRTQVIWCRQSPLGVKYWHQDLNMKDGWMCYQQQTFHVCGFDLGKIPGIAIFMLHLLKCLWVVSLTKTSRLVQENVQSGRMFELAAKICQCAKCANKALKSGQMRFQSFSVCLNII